MKTRDLKTIEVLESIFPWNLVLDILRLREGDAAERWRTLASVYSLGVMDALETLTDRERTVIKRRYRDNDTLDQIGKDYGVRKERIRQIEAKALRKLGHPARTELFVCVTQAQYRALKHDFWELQDRYLQLREKMSAEEWEAAGEQENSDLMATPLADLDLSVRSYNCLIRAGVKTVGDIVNMPRSKMRRIRNFGQKSMDEVLGRLRALGVDLNHEEES